VELRRLASHEVDLHRDLRLRALGDAPDSFGETFTDAAVRPISYWEELTRAVTEPGRDVMFLACEGNDILDSAYGLLDRACSDAGRVGGMWVGRTWRRRGVGRALLQEVISWGRERRLRRLGLWAPSHNPAAIAHHHGDRTDHWLLVGLWPRDCALLPFSGLERGRHHANDTRRGVSSIEAPPHTGARCDKARDIASAVEASGPIDVLVNNAGIGLFGAIEATPMATVRDLFETNDIRGQIAYVR
jgi:GNAT superfamily N-acetyltransferase